MNKTLIDIECAKISGTVDDFLAEPPGKYRHAAHLPLRQYWISADAMPVERAECWLGATEEHLSFFVAMTDSHIFSEAKNNDDKLFCLGDTVEFFIKPGRMRKDYWEIHISPNNLILDLHIPSRQKYMEKVISWQEIITADSNAFFQARSFPQKKQWAVELAVPWTAFNVKKRPSEGTVWQFAVCRYNYSGNLEDPELSSTALFSHLGFHRYEEYHDLIF